VVPLSAGRQALGALVVEHPVRLSPRIERRVVGMLERFAGHAALALRNAWLLEEIQHVAATDGLTGIPNRATFQRVLAQEIARVRRNGGSVGLVLADIDFFKVLNDTHGHQTGDEVLKRVAAVLDESSRGFDTATRYGGEEFAIVLPQTTPEEAMAVAERLRLGVEQSAIEPPVTVSLGVATFPDDAADDDALVKAADEALYASKRGGRNRVTQASLTADL
jgi:diguanylate cyclase (GGDEF)-like protein